MSPRFGAALFFGVLVCALLVACASAPPSLHASAGATDAGTDPSANDAADAIDRGDGGDASIDPRAAFQMVPPLDPMPIPGFAEESRADVAVVNEASVDIAFATDSCVRVVFSAGDPVSARVGSAHADASQGGMLAARGPLCERAGKHLTLIFSGNANVRYVVFRSTK